MRKGLWVFLPGLLTGLAIAPGSDWLVSAAFASCASPENPIVAENCLAGSPSSQWDISGGGDESIQGFATDISVNRGGTVFFKVDTDSTDYHLDIYRMGYYGGMGARQVATVTPSVTLPQNQPSCLTDVSTGLVDCGNWAVSASWAVPANATSGIYFAKLVRTDTGAASHIFFVVRDDASTSDILVQTSDTTWQAYNDYGGNSLYVGSPAGRAYKVSYNRPFITRGNQFGRAWVMDAEYPMVRWLEANGYDVSYAAGVDTDRHGRALLQHPVFMSSGHDEYWSGAQRAHVEAARAAGVHLAFFSGDAVFWKTRWEPSIDGTGTAYRTLVTYKETHANAVIDPQDPPTWTGTWRDPRFSPPADGNNPENGLTGTLFKVNCCQFDAITVSQAQGQMRLWRNTALASLGAGQSSTIGAGTIGYEWDESPDNGFQPPGLIKLSTTTINVPSYLQDFGTNVCVRHGDAQPDSVPSRERRARVQCRVDPLGVGLGHPPRRRSGQSRLHSAGQCLHAAGDCEPAGRHVGAAGDPAEWFDDRDGLDGWHGPHVHDHGAAQWRGPGAGERGDDHRHRQR